MKEGAFFVSLRVQLEASRRGLAQGELNGMVGKTASFKKFSLCLSRACLGKMFVFIYKWLKHAVFRRFHRWVTSSGRPAAWSGHGSTPSVRDQIAVFVAPFSSENFHFI